MRIVSDVKNRNELREIKSIMEIFIVNKRIKQLAEKVYN